jgi:sugar phosphate isomerase/epimerase
MALVDQPLTLCAGSMVRYAFGDFVDAAAHAGFAAVTLTKRDRHLARRREGLTADEMGARIRDLALRVAEVEGTADWLPGDSPAPTGRELGFAEALDLATAWGASSVVLFHDGRPAASPGTLAGAFAAACDRAADSGVTLAIEFLPWSPIGDVYTALQIVEEAGRANGRVLFDTWHHGHSGVPSFSLTPRQAALISCIQLDDARPPESDDIVHETMFRRCLPGTGVLDLAPTLAALDAAGVACPVAAEVFDETTPSDTTAREWAGLLVETTRRTLATSRSPG